MEHCEHRNNDTKKVHVCDCLMFVAIHGNLRTMLTTDSASIDFFIRMVCDGNKNRQCHSFEAVTQSSSTEKQTKVLVPPQEDRKINHD